jgi:hypothetical protein
VENWNAGILELWNIVKCEYGRLEAWNAGRMGQSNDLKKLPFHYSIIPLFHYSSPEHSIVPVFHVSIIPVFLG